MIESLRQELAVAVAKGDGKAEFFEVNAAAGIGTRAGSHGRCPAQRYWGQDLRAVRRLLWRDHPTEPVVDAIKVALEHRLFSLPRLERMMLPRR